MERRGVCPLQLHPASPRRHLEAGGRVQSAGWVAVAEKGDVKGVAYCSRVRGLTPNGSYLLTAVGVKRRCTHLLVEAARTYSHERPRRCSPGEVAWSACGHRRRLAPAPLPVGEARLASIKEAVGVERRLRPPPRRGLEEGLVGAVDVAVVQPEERVEARGRDLLAQ